MAYYTNSEHKFNTSLLFSKRNVINLPHICDESQCLTLGVLFRFSKTIQGYGTHNSYLNDFHTKLEIMHLKNKHY